jgi:hypothetical protein
MGFAALCPSYRLAMQKQYVGVDTVAKFWTPPTLGNVLGNVRLIAWSGFRTNHPFFIDEELAVPALHVLHHVVTGTGEVDSRNVLYVGNSVIQAEAFEGN